MDINFPLILVVLVFGSGLIVLLDKLLLSKKRKSGKQPILVEYSRSFFPVLLIVLILRSFLVEPFQIPSTSMVPTLEVGDFILVNKYTYGIRLPVIRTKTININNPQRGDVMVFFPPHEKRYFIKRVIGLPGDKISTYNNEVFVNDEPLKLTFIANESERLSNLNDRCIYRGENYQLFEQEINNETHRIRKCTKPVAFPENKMWLVPEGHYFMMGDNRDNSSDSRDWGFVPEENIVGKAFAIWMHWDGLSSLPSFSRVGAIK
ncbi:MAG: signal peptidase I [Cellvibrionaceae bacterium]|jgi:signal peptidase I